MEIAALVSFLLLIVSWMALPASVSLETEKRLLVARPRTVGAEA